MAFRNEAQSVKSNDAETFAEEACKLDGQNLDRKISELWIWAATQNASLEKIEKRLAEIETQVKAFEERVAAMEKDVAWNNDSVKYFDRTLRKHGELWTAHDETHRALNALIYTLRNDRETTSVLLPAPEIADEFKDAPAIPREVLQDDAESR